VLLHQNSFSGSVSASLGNLELPHQSVFLVLRLCHAGASIIGSELIAMTPLQQEKRVHRSAKKAVPYQGKNDLPGVSMTHLSRV
jgi:hypothetical protein